jgi:prophage regulatory protein
MREAGTEGKMTKNTTISIADARALASQWGAQYEDHLRTVAIANRFKGASPSEVIRMWESGRNERGQKLSQMEFTALVERWLELFRAYPAETDATSDGSADNQLKQPQLEDDSMLRMPEVTRVTGLSKSTIKRRVSDGTFPKPMHLSPRRIGWPAREVKDWLDRLDDHRYATRQ